jgi:hypothetical protein
MTDGQNISFSRIDEHTLHVVVASARQRQVVEAVLRAINEQWTDGGEFSVELTQRGRPRPPRSAAKKSSGSAKKSSATKSSKSSAKKSGTALKKALTKKTPVKKTATRTPKKKPVKKPVEQVDRELVAREKDDKGVTTGDLGPLKKR